MGLRLGCLYPLHRCENIFGEGRGLILEGVFFFAIDRWRADTAAVAVLSWGQWVFGVRAFGAGGLGTRGWGALDPDFLDGLSLLEGSGGRRGIALGEQGQRSSKVVAAGTLWCLRPRGVVGVVSGSSCVCV